VGGQIWHVLWAFFVVSFSGPS